MTGGAIGSGISQMFHLTAAERKTLLVAGAAAGMSATFATPVAAVLLAVELLLFEWKPRRAIPVALASATAGAAGMIALGDLLTARVRNLNEERHRERVLQVRLPFGRAYAERES